VLEVDGLQKTYRQSIGMFGGDGYNVHAVDSIDLSAAAAETLAIVGESGCGKPTLAKVLTGIEQATGGKVLLAGKDIGAIAVEKRDSATKRAIQMVFQNPDSTLNPSHTVGYVMERALAKLKGLSGRKAKDEVN